jgi:hypothetical protein
MLTAASFNVALKNAQCFSLDTTTLSNGVDK